MTKFKDINPTELLNAVFPYTEKLKLTNAVYYKIGVSGWKTLFIFYEEYYSDSLNLLIVCKHHRFCEERQLTGSVEELIKEINEAESLLHFFEYPKNTTEHNSLQLMENVRLYKYLKGIGIKLFEPTL